MPPPVLDAALELSPEVAVRPERFGALLYHFGSRRLSFVKDERLLAVVERLAEFPSARGACDAAGVPPSQLASFGAALGRLAATGMVRERAS